MITLALVMTLPDVRWWRRYTDVDGAKLTTAPLTTVKLATAKLTTFGDMQWTLPKHR